MIHFAIQIIYVSTIDHVPHLKWLLVILEFQINLRMLNETLKIILAEKSKKAQANEVEGWSREESFEF